MKSHVMELTGGRMLFIESIRSLTEVTKKRLSKPFVTLFPACNAEELAGAQRITSELIDLGCIEFCFVGKLSDELHDSIDWIIEDRGAFHIVTTSFPIMDDEGVDYVLNLAGGGSGNLLALIADDEAYVTALLQIIAE